MELKLSTKVVKMVFIQKNPRLLTNGCTRPPARLLPQGQRRALIGWGLPPVRHQAMALPKEHSEPKRVWACRDKLLGANPGLVKCGILFIDANNATNKIRLGAKNKEDDFFGRQTHMGTLGYSREDL